MSTSNPTPSKRPRVTHRGGGDSRTVQSDRQKANLHSILDKYRTSGILPTHRRALAQYGDFTVAQDYLDAVEKVRSTEELFQTLPSGTRAELENDPFQLLRMMTDPDMRPRALELGLVEPTEAELRAIGEKTRKSTTDRLERIRRDAKILGLDEDQVEKLLADQEGGAPSSDEKTDSGAE